MDRIAIASGRSPAGMTVALADSLRAVTGRRERREVLRKAAPSRETIGGLLAEARTWRRRDPATATLLARASLAVARAGKAPELAAEAAHVLGQAELLLGRPRQALRHQRAAAARAEPSIRMSVAIETASTLAMLGHESEARSALADARRLIPRRNRASIGALIDVTEANLLSRLDRDADALELYARARRVLSRRKQPGAIAAIDGNRANCLSNLHRYAEADRVYARAARQYRRLEQEAMALRVDYNRAYLHHLRGRLHRALDELTAMRERFLPAGDEQHVALCDLDLAEILLRLDVPAEAAERARFAAERLAHLGFAHEAARARLFLAAAIRGLGRTAEARAALETARASLRDVGSAAWEAVAAHRLAEIDEEEGAYDRAARRGHEAAERLFGLGLIERGGRADVLVARVLLARGDAEGARRRLEALSARLRGVHAPWLVCELRRTWARTMAALGDPRAGLRHALAAVSVLERHRVAVPPDEHLVSFLREKAAVHELAVRLTLDVGGRGAVDRAYRLAQQSVEGSAIDRVARSPRADRTASAARCDELAHEIDGLLGRMPNDDAHRRAGTASRAASSAAARDRRLGACLARLEPRRGAARRSETPTPPQLRRSLPRGVALVELRVGSDDTVAFVARRGSLRAERLPLPRAKASALVAAVRSAVDEAGGDGPDATERALRAVSEAVFGPLEAALGNARRVVVVPDRVLERVPLWAPGRPGARAGREVVVAPSAGTYLRAASSDHGAAGVTLLLSLSTPLPSGIQTKVESAAAARAAAKRHFEPEDGRRGTDVRSTSDGRRGREKPSGAGSLEVQAEVVVVSGVPESAPAGAVSDLATEFLRAGARSVIVSLWPVEAAADRVFVRAVHGALSSGSSSVQAVRTSTEAVRAQFPAARSWGGWCVFGSGGPLEEVS